MYIRIQESCTNKKKAIKSSDLHFMAQKIGGGSRFLQKLKILQNLPEKKEGCSVPPPCIQTFQEQ